MTVDSLAADLRYTLRSLRASPAFTAVAILSLALGAGANTAIFSLIDAVMLKSLPVDQPEQLVQVSIGSGAGFTNPLLEQIRDRQDVFTGIFAYGRWAFNLAPGGEVRPVNGYFASGEFFETLRVRAVLGRTLSAADDTRGCSGAVVLTYGFWQREYGGRPDIVGRTISINRHPMPVAGIAEPRFMGVDVGSSVDIIAPLCSAAIINRDVDLLELKQLPGWLWMMARLKPGITPVQAGARLKTLAPEIYKATLPPTLRAEDQEQYLRGTFDVQPAANGLSYLRRQYREALFILLAATAFILLIACANLANLLLARGAARQREFAIRLAVGAGRGRLIRHLFTESLLISIAGTAAGILLAHWSTRLLVRSLDATLDLAPDLRVFAFTAAIAVLSALFFGIAPAWRASQVEPQNAMKANLRGISEGSRFGLGKTLVALQIALSLALTAGAGLLLGTFWKLTSLDAGFDRGYVLLAGIDLPRAVYLSARRVSLYEDVLQGLRALPGVQSASLSNITPICHCQWTGEIALDGFTPKSRSDATIYRNQVSDRYFETFGIPILAGRDFNAHDTPGSPRVALINATMARKFFGTASPIGQHFRIRERSGFSQPIEIVGVVKDAKYSSLRHDIPATAYTAWAQDGTPAPLTKFALRASGGAPSGLIPAVKSAIRAIDPAVAIQFTTLAEQVDESISRERLLAILSGFFGALALLLASIGIYGVLSHNVARRSGEIGIRMALGAGRARIQKLILGEIAVLVGLGLTAGLAAAMATTRLLTAFLYQLQPDDPATLALAAAILAAVAFTAGYLPVRRASTLDPMAALRDE